jgi:hypothetical protein
LSARRAAGKLGPRCAGATSAHPRPRASCQTITGTGK